MLPSQTDRLNDACQQLTSRSNKRLAVLVFLLTASIVWLQYRAIDRLRKGGLVGVGVTRQTRARPVPTEGQA